MPKNGRSARIHARSGSTNPLSRNVLIVSPNAPTPGKINASTLSSIEAASATSTLSRPSARNALRTLCKLPAP